jgi:DNA-binding MarR family transcriptional regulator
MSFEPNPQQALLIFTMLLGEKPEEREPKFGDWPSKVRGPLITNGFIAKQQLPGKRRVYKLKLTPAGERLAVENLICRLPERSPRSKRVVKDLLSRLGPFLLTHRAEILRVLSADADTEVTLETIGAQIRDAYLAQTKGAPKQRVLLKDLRPKVGVQREDFDEALLSLQRESKVVLMGLDNPMERTPEVEAAALHIQGNPRHLVYFQG